MTTNIETFCKQGLAETPLWEQMNHIMRAQDILRTGLPPDYQDSVRVANIKTSCLIVAVANSALATKIRFLSPALITHCRKKGLAINQIRCQISSTPRGESR